MKRAIFYRCDAYRDLTNHCSEMKISRQNCITHLFTRSISLLLLFFLAVTKHSTEVVTTAKNAVFLFSGRRALSTTGYDEKFEGWQKMKEEEELNLLRDMKTPPLSLFLLSLFLSLCLSFLSLSSLSLVLVVVVGIVGVCCFY